jgi:hypothetical protein
MQVLRRHALQELGERCVGIDASNYELLSFQDEFDFRPVGDGHGASRRDGEPHGQAVAPLS